MSNKITQLFEHLELYSEGDPANHTLFILGRQSLAVVNPLEESSDQLLLIDPPLDAVERFQLEGDIAALYTASPREVNLPQMQTIPGGVAHIRIGQHFLDIYSQAHGAIVHLPALGVLCSGSFGSDAALPKVGLHSDGAEELETSRLLARLVKQHRLQLFIPQIGQTCNDQFQVMQRLAADVAYLHGLRRVIPAAVERGDSLDDIQSTGASLLPKERATENCQNIHQENIQIIVSNKRGNAS